HWRNTAILKPRFGAKGYFIPALCKNGSESRIMAHRLVAISFLGPPPIGMTLVNHKNGFKQDNRVENLEWSNNSLNQRHAFKIGLNVRIKGVDSPSSKLTDDQVLEIRSLRKKTPQLNNWQIILM
ncbi:MAG: HNH endonuclease signature motif containing protein, partial [Nanoarchaeota archaeon]